MIIVTCQETKVVMVNSDMPGDNTGHSDMPGDTSGHDMPGDNSGRGDMPGDTSGHSQARTGSGVWVPVTPGPSLNPGPL